jgi:2-methylisocitrate lyase-like PEP mutase family enzyme
MSQKTSRREFLGAAGMAAGVVTGIMAGSTSVEPAAAQAKQVFGTQKSAKLRQLLDRPGTFYCIAAFDGPSARLVEISGFDSIYVGGSLAAMEKSLPDQGMTNTQELLEFCRRISDNVDIPVIGDCDNGGGSPLTVYRATRDYERAGLAGVLFEDRIRLEKIGQQGDVVSTAAMVERIHAAVDARTSMQIVGRTDALGVKKTEQETIERCQAYAEAGADMILIPGVQPLDLMKRVASVVKKPMLCQMGPDTAKEDAIKTGAKVLFYTSMVQDIALAAYLQSLTELKNTGKMPNTFNTHKLPKEITPLLEKNEELLARAKKYKVSP